MATSFSDTFYMFVETHKPLSTQGDKPKQIQMLTGFPALCLWWLMATSVLVLETRCVHMCSRGVPPSVSPRAQSQDSIDTGAA